MLPLVPFMNDEIFKSNVDVWIKQLNARMSKIEERLNLNIGETTENIDNIQHNYELIYELGEQIEELKHEINALKLIQIITLKQNAKEEKKIIHS